LRNLLVINPNTSASVTQLLHFHIQAVAGNRVRVHAVTAPFGAPYITDEVSYAVAAHATLDAWNAWSAAAHPTEATEATLAVDAVIIGCFGDPGLFAMRELCTVPVIGLAEASFAQAARHGRFAIVTGGVRWRPMLERLASATGYGAALAGIRTIEPTGSELAADPAWARGLLTKACRDAAREFRASAIVLGGAGLAGMAAELQADVDVPVIDSVLAGAEKALVALRV
jgi:allantoin racemase